MDQKSLVPASPAMNQGEIQLLRETYFKGANDNHVRLALHLASHYELDPFLREIWFSDKIGILVGRDGLLKVARRNPDFEGIVSGVIYPGGQAFELDAETGEPKINPDAGKILAGKEQPVGAWAIAYRRGCRPMVRVVRFSEYFKGGNVAWTNYPSAMIAKVAEVMVLKAAFGITGLNTDVELEDEIRDSRSVETTIEMAEISAAKNPPQVETVQTQPAAPNVNTLTPATPAKEAPKNGNGTPAQVQAPERISDDDFFGILNKIGRHSPEAKKWAFGLMSGKTIGAIDQPERHRIWNEIAKVAVQKGIAL